MRRAQCAYVRAGENRQLLKLSFAQHEKQGMQSSCRPTSHWHVHAKRKWRRKISKDTMAIVCLWAVVGLVLAVVMVHLGFDAEVAAALATAG